MKVRNGEKDYTNDPFLKPDYEIKSYHWKFWFYKNDKLVFGILLFLMILSFGFVIIDQLEILKEYLGEPLSFNASLSFLALLLSLYFGFIRVRNSDMQTFFNLFEKFNQKYDNLNDHLQGLNEFLKDHKEIDEFNFKNFEKDDLSIKELEESLDKGFEYVIKNCRYFENTKIKSSRKIKNLMEDYFNLCAEQYFAYKNGYIPPKVFIFWKRGMDDIFKNYLNRYYLLQEIESSDSYYSFQELLNKKWKGRLKNIQDSKES